MQSQHPQNLNNSEWPKLKFYGGYDQLKADYAEEQGAAGKVLVEFEDGRLYHVWFEDIDNVKYIISRSSKEEGLPFYAEAGMILLEKVTLKNMRIAVKKLAEGGEV